jgi:Zn-dependent protease with chaperone function
MTVAACLLAYSFVTCVMGPRLLCGLTRDGAAPRLGVLTWLATICSVIAAWVFAVAFLVGELLRDWKQPGRIASACMAALRHVAAGDSGVLLQFGLLALTFGAFTAIGTAAWCLSRSLLRARRLTHRHARDARIVGRHVRGVEAVVLDSPERVAYCVAGRPSTIVVTSATLEALDGRQLRAVLAHERAHLAGHHHQILAVTRGLAGILHGVRLFTVGEREVARLLEMCADDAAARRHGTRTLLDALAAVCGSAPLPSGALGATGVDVLARAERLADPVTSGARWWARLVLSTVTLAVVGGLLLTGVLAVTGFALCNPWPT